MEEIIFSKWWLWFTFIFLFFFTIIFKHDTIRVEKNINYTCAIIYFNKNVASGHELDAVLAEETS